MDNPEVFGSADMISVTVAANFCCYLAYKGP